MKKPSVQIGPGSFPDPGPNMQWSTAVNNGFLRCNLDLIPERITTSHHPLPGTGCDTITVEKGKKDAGVSLSQQGFGVLSQLPQDT